MDNPEKLAIQHWVHKAQNEDKNKTKTQHRKLKRLARRTLPKTQHRKLKRSATRTTPKKNTEN